MENEDLVTLTADIVSAHLSNNAVGIQDVPALIKSIHGALAGLGVEEEVEEVAPEPVVSVRASVKKDNITCLLCGSKQKMMKRHLATAHDLTVDEYRSTFNLPADYPMVAPDYAEKRRELAKKIGLGRKPRQRRGAKK